MKLNANRYLRLYFAHRGLVASLVVLQRRWWELKQWTRKGLLAKWHRKDSLRDDGRYHLYPIHLAIAKRYGP